MGLSLSASVVVLPGGLNAFTLPKLATACAGVALALWGPRRWKWPRPVVVCLAAAASAVVVAAMISDDPVGQLIGVAPRYPGLVSLLPYFGVAMAGAQLKMSGESRWLVGTLSTCAAAVALVSASETLGFRPLASDVARPGSLLGNASDAGQWGVLALGLCSALWLHRRDRASGAGLLMSGAVVALSGSRAALLGVLVACVAVAVLRQHRTAPVVALVVVGAALLIPSVGARVTGNSPLAERTATGRALLWQESLSLVVHEPLGVGPGGYADAIPAEHDERYARAVGPSTPASSPESWPLELLVVGGPLLLLAGLGLAGLTARSGWRQRADPAVAGMTAGLLGYGTALLFGAVSPGPGVLAALFAGSLLAVDRGRCRQRPVSIAYAVLAVLLAAGAVAEVPLRRALELVGTGDVTHAHASFAAARELRGWDPNLSMLEGHAFAAASAAGNPEATSWCISALAPTHRSLAVLADLATCQENLAHFEEAAALLRQAAWRDPTNALTSLRQGVLAAELKDYAAAEAFLQRAARLAPTSPDPWVDLAQLYRLLGDSSGEQAALSEAARRRP